MNKPPEWAVEMAKGICGRYPEGPDPEVVAEFLTQVREQALEEAENLVRLVGTDYLNIIQDPDRAHACKYSADRIANLKQEPPK